MRGANQDWGSLHQVLAMPLGGAPSLAVESSIFHPPEHGSLPRPSLHTHDCLSWVYGEDGAGARPLLRHQEPPRAAGTLESIKSSISSQHGSYITVQQYNCTAAKKVRGHTIGQWCHRYWQHKQYRPLLLGRDQKQRVAGTTE